MTKIRIFVISLLFLQLFTVNKKGIAQAITDFRKIDSLTYVLYEKKQWRELIDLSEKGIREGFDYYFMRMRAGIARYETKNFRRAGAHFEKALKHNDGDQDALGYLYFCYLFSGREPDAKRIIPKLTLKTRTAYGIEEPKYLDEIYVEGGPGIPNNQLLKEKRENLSPGDTIYNSTTYFKTFGYIHGGIRMNILPFLSTYQGYSRVNAPAEQEITFHKAAYQPFVFHACQNEYYGTFNIAVPYGMSITPTLHLLMVNFDFRDVFYNPATYQLDSDTSGYYEYYYLLSLSVSKEVVFGSIDLHGTYGELNGSIVRQLGLSGNYYPWGNTDLYVKLGFVNFWDNEGYRPVFISAIGARLMNKLWFEGDVTIGSLKNYSEKNIFVVYNAPEDIRNKYEAVITYDVTKHLELSFRYRYLTRENGYLSYMNYDRFEIEKTNYPYHSIIGGIKWNL